MGADLKTKAGVIYGEDVRTVGTGHTLHVRMGLDD